MRNRYIVAYDIRNPNRLRRVYVKMRGFGEALQYSVFVCDLSMKERSLMISELTVLIAASEDSIAIVNIGSPNGEITKRVEFLGKIPEIKERTAVIV